MTSMQLAIKKFKRISHMRGDDQSSESLNLQFDLSDDDIKQKRSWNRITDHDRLKLEISVSFGLSGNSACKIVKLGQCNAARLLKE